MMTLGRLYPKKPSVTMPETLIPVACIIAVASGENTLAPISDINSIITLPIIVLNKSPLQAKETKGIIYTILVNMPTGK